MQILAHMILFDTRTGNILPALHAFTGYNTTSTFVREGETIRLLISLVSLMFISLGRSSDMPHHTRSISCACYTIGIQPLRYKRFASCKVCKKIHLKTRKGTFNYNGVGIAAFYHHAEMH